MSTPKIDHFTIPGTDPVTSLPIRYNKAFTIVGPKNTSANFTDNTLVQIDTIQPTITVRQLKTLPQSLTVLFPPEISQHEGTYSVKVSNDAIVGESMIEIKAGGPKAAAVVSRNRIAVLSSIAYKNTSFQRNFELGLGRLPFGQQWNINSDYEKCGYSSYKLKDAADKVCDSTKYDVVVSFGGNIVAEALAPIAEQKKMKFLSVVGTLTPYLSGLEYAFGGINLDSPSRNAERFRHLTQVLKIPASEICFLSNRQSAMAFAEQQQWKQLNPTGRIFSFNPLEWENDLTALKENFGALFDDFARDGALTTMVISADPAFQQFKDYLIAAANNVNKTICYPLQTYRNNNGPQPKPGWHLLHGPQLARACFDLGRDAAAVALGSASEKIPFRIPPMLIDAPDDET